MKNTCVYDCTIIEFDKHHHEKGNITVVDFCFLFFFVFLRSLYLYDIFG